MSEAFIWGSSGFVALYFLRLNRNNFYSLALASVGLLDDILKTEDDDEKLIRVQKNTKELIVLLIKVFLLIFVSALRPIGTTYDDILRQICISYFSNGSFWLVVHLKPLDHR